jgi:hypothetical protein
VNDNSGPVPKNTRNIVRVLLKSVSRKDTLENSLGIRLRTETHALGTDGSRVGGSRGAQLRKIRVLNRQYQLH